ncbi:MAG: DUF2461 domain-containing protein [Bacteroidales bacterium]|nr:DUF2461 domain-containing protein [Bacteroidales bacterium]
MRRILNFLSELEQNNNRDWFEQNRAAYEEARSLFEGFIAEVLSSLSRIDSRLRALTPKQVIFRIYRDTRFAHDKTPYKNNFGAHLSRGGRNTGEPGLVDRVIEQYALMKPFNDFLYRSVET